MRLSRRPVLRSGLATLVAAVVPPIRGVGAEPVTAPEASVTPLAVTLRAARRVTAVDRLSYDGTPSGPVLRVPFGIPLAVALTNALDVPTALSWQGLRDGPNGAAPADPLAGALQPGASATWRFTPPDSGTFWFGAAALPGSQDQAAMGLRGLLIVEEPTPPACDHDLAFVLSDAAGGAVLVDAAPAPRRVEVVTGARVRLRLLNASTARLMVVAVEGAHPQVVAVDGQPSSLFAPLRDSVPIAPGARFDLVLDAPRVPGALVRVRLRSLLPASPEGTTFDPMLVELTTAGAPAPARAPIAALPANPALPPAIALENAERADLVIERLPNVKGGAAAWRVNGVASLGLPVAPLLTVARGTPVTLGFDNRSPVAVALRVSGQAMRLLHARDDGWEPYWRDGVVLPPHSVTHVAFVPTVAGRWLIDSAIFDQGALGLRSWLAVT